MADPHLPHQLRARPEGDDDQAAALRARVARLEDELADARVALIAIGANVGPYLARLEDGGYDDAGAPPPGRREPRNAS